MRLTLGLALVVSMLVACRDAATAPGDGKAAPVQSASRFVVAASDGVVIDEPMAAHVSMLGCGEPPVGLTGFWRPGATELAALEAALPAWLESHIAPIELPLEQREIRMNRQYLGMYRAGRRVVLINAWPNDRGIGRALTSEQLFISCGGGALNFRLLFDAAANSFSDFQGNGAI